MERDGEKQARAEVVAQAFSLRACRRASGLAFRATLLRVSQTGNANLKGRRYSRKPEAYATMLTPT